MFNEYNATLGELIIRSLDHIEQGRMHYIEISYKIADTEVNVTAEARKIKKEND